MSIASEFQTSISTDLLSLGYYAPIFKSVQQKNISGYLKQLWAADDFHTKWAILAKAYALLRAELSKEEAPLDTFLDLTAPYAGALSREAYFDTMGWTLTDNGGDKILVRAFVPSPAMIPDTYRYTMVSSEELVDYCIANNFLSRECIAKFRRTTVGVVDQTMAIPPPSRSSPQPQHTTSKHTGMPHHDTESAIDKILRDALEPKTRQGNAHISRPADPRDTAECRGTTYGGMMKMSGLPVGQLFDPLDDLQFPSFDPSSGPRDAVFDISDPSLYTSVDACNVNYPEDLQMQLAMQEYLGF